MVRWSLVFYAGKTAGDDTNRYLWGWCPTREGQKTTGTKNWAGALVAHRLIQNGDGTLSLDVPQAISAKYSQSVTLTEKTKVGGCNGQHFFLYIESKFICPLRPFEKPEQNNHDCNNP